MTNNKLTDEKIKIRIKAIEDRRSASRDFWDGDYEYAEDIELLALLELQELRRNYLALRGEIEDVQSQLYEAENQANEYASELQEHRKAAAEPVLYVMGMGCAFDAETASTCKGAVDSWVGEWNQERLPGQEEYKTVPLYATPQSAPERDQIRREHAAWSQATFGDVGPVGSLKHLSKEALEAAAEPGDLSEWADMQFLLWDAQRRAGISDEQITLAMKEKLAANKKREWPEPKDGEPRLHIKEQPVPLMLDKDELLPCSFCGGKARQVTIELDDDPNFGGDVITCTECWASSHVEFGLKENLKSAWNSRAALLQGKFLDLSQPVDPQIAEYEQIMLQAGWVMVPVEPTDEMIAAAMECDDVVFDSTDPTAFCVQYREIYCAMVDAAPKPELTSE